MATRHDSIEEFLAKHPTMKLRETDNIKQVARAPEKKEKGKKKRVPREEMKPLHIPDINFSTSTLPADRFPRYVKITLPFPPQTNNLYYTQIQADGTPMRFKSYKYKQYYEEVRGSSKKQGILSRIPPIILKGKLIIKMKCYRPKDVGDWDGYIKAPQDVLKGWFFDDDDQIVRGEIDKLLDRINPRVEIEIYEVDFPNGFKLG